MLIVTAYMTSSQLKLKDLDHTANQAELDPHLQIRQFFKQKYMYSYFSNFSRKRYVVGTH